ncbi:TatD family hydrolase [Streptomyces plumbiresistens]|uniref:TatD family hydrolase n=1 Tax=Streptomyces plumbiresistens TaxID=511811 RepID=A0ABP7SK65_9ACTN
MTAGLIDCHAHLAHFDRNLEELEAGLEHAGIALLLSSGMDLESSRAAVDLASRSPRVLGAIGLHPWHVTDDWANEQTLSAFSALAADPNCVAISEVGLDTSAVDVPLPLQREALMWFVGLAQRESLPMVLHLQVPVDELLDVWSKIDGPLPKAAIHGFAGTTRDAQLLVEHGFWLSLGTITTGQLLGVAPVDDQVVRAVPDDRMLLDSDAYVPAELLRTVTALTPDLRDWLDGASPLEAGSLRQVAEHVASVRGTSVEELAEVVRLNFNRFVDRRDD